VDHKLIKLISVIEKNKYMTAYLSYGRI